MLTMGKDMHVWGWGVYEKSLHLPLVVNLKLLEKKKSLKKQQKTIDLVQCPDHNKCRGNTGILNNPSELKGKDQSKTLKYKIRREFF